MNGLIQFATSITLLSVVKVLILALLIVYTTFAALMMQQIRAMTRAVTIKDDYLIRILGIAHFVFALAVLLLAFFVL